MRVANKYNVIKNTASQNYTLVNLIEEILGEPGFEYPIDNHLESLIMSDFAESNYKLSYTFLGGNTEWYTSKRVTNKKSIMHGLTVEEAIKVAAHIWNYFQKNE